METYSDRTVVSDESRSPGQGRVLVVDDEFKTRELLRAILESNGHEVREATDGQDAINQLADEKRGLPDVVLLDIIMPRLSGYETCKRIRANSRTAHLPIIVVTGLADRDDRLHAIRDGANDFLTKPFDATEVALRVGNGIASKRMFDRVTDDVRRLRELEDVRDRLVHMIVHDLRQPLTALRGYVDYLISLGKLGRSANMLQAMKRAVERMEQMITSLLDIQKLETGKMKLVYGRCILDDLVHTVVERFTGPSSAHISIEVRTEDPTIELLCDEELIGRVVSNLVDNAVKHAPKDSTVEIRVASDGNDASVTVIDSGAGIAKEHQSRIFEKFEQISLFSEGHRFSWGLGLTFCKMAIEAHNGTIGVISEPGKGSHFWFRLPRNHVQAVEMRAN